MNKENYISVAQLCSTYEVEMGFIYDLKENDLIELSYLDDRPCIHQDLLEQLEKILRLHHDLQINIEGIQAVFNLVHQVEDLQANIQFLKNRLKIYEA